MFRESVFENLARGFSSAEIFHLLKVRKYQLKE